MEVTIEEVWRGEHIPGQESRIYKTSQPLWDAIDPQGMREIRLGHRGDMFAEYFEYICITHQIEDIYKFGAGKIPATLALTSNDMGNTMNYAPLPGSMIGWFPIEQVVPNLQLFLKGLI
jgi:hypothetical protein